MVGRRRAVPAALLTAVLLVSIVPAVGSAASSPPNIDRFLNALGRVESGGRYTARNVSTGAYGKYQIMPASWAGWARAYLGTSSAPQTPKNQETVARRKVTALHRWLDAWPTVAHWWLTGSSERNARLWSSYSRSYVAKVMKAMGGSGSAAVQGASSRAWIDAKDTRLDDASAAITYGPGWRSAGYSAYVGRRATYSTRRGSWATMTFTGTGIAWVGPVGPTRGTATVYVDGKLAATVNLRRSTFDPRSILFARSLKAGQHTIRIVVTTSGRPVAVDQLIVGT
ncbi:MAG TPA: transglycosylase family protein [Patescibacteria group bacterium]|nr:transglycosylase family protein [Patescibacteria group bacterium]